MTSLRFLVLLALPLSSTLLAQQAADGPPGGTVSGTITCGDTQRPARFAGVTLTPVPDDKPPAPEMSDKEMKDNPEAAMKQIRAKMGSITMLQGQTGLDGVYVIANVPAGDYYVSPSAAGYVSPIAAAMAAAPAGSTGKKLYEGTPVVHVEANRTVRGDVTLERGAAVSGTVTFDDGAPAGKLIVTIEKSADEKPDAGQAAASGLAMLFGGGAANLIAIADDRGRFRLAGLAPGEYVVKTTLQVGNSFSMRNGQMDMSGLTKASPLVLFAPGTLHKKDAVKLTLKAGEEKTDVDITVGLNGMHTVSGRVASAVDHHGLNAGSVELVDATDKAFKRSASVDATGAFTVSYVPAGSYTLGVSDGADTEPAKKKPGAVMNFATAKTVKSYEDATQPLMVGASDVTGVNVELKESKTVKKDIDFSELFKQ